MTQRWKSQKFDAEGSATAPGILRQLGRPSLDEFSILVREAAQNSWDARRGDCDVDFTIRIERLGDRAASWREILLPGPSDQSIPDFGRSLRPESWYIVVSDRGTNGLGGPVRATDRPADGERNDFVQFMRNVGEPRDKELGGGTYGFGKGIFYRTSSVGTILADSRIRLDGAFQRRLMGAALGSDYWDADDTRFTGRHWWGALDDDVADPVVGAAAEAIARALGLPDFGPDETGTNIVILGADLGLISDEETGPGDPRALGAHLASAMLWNLWPKFRSVSKPTATAMRFSVAVDGEAIVLPEPHDVLVLRPFVESFTALSDSDKRSYRRTSVPRIHAGDLAVRVGVAPRSETAVVRSARPFLEAPHHVARMRQAGLVVDYLPGPVHPDPLFAYGGVFMAAVEADSYFAASEPPTHDRWNPEGLERDPKAVVEGARRWIRDDLNRRFPAGSAQASGASGSGLGQGSRRLSALVAGVSATGADATGSGAAWGREGGGRGRSGTRPGASIVGDPWIATSNGGLRVFANVKASEPSLLTSIRAHLDVVVDGGRREETAPAGATAPRVLGWTAQSNPVVMRVGPVLTDLDGEENWTVVAQFSDTAITRFRLEVEVAGSGA